MKYQYNKTFLAQANQKLARGLCVALASKTEVATIYE